MSFLEVKRSLIALVMLATMAAAPAPAQFGAIKKKVKAAAGAESKEQPAPAAKDGAGDGGTIVVNDDVVDRYIQGLKARQTEREAAPKADTPYGRYLHAKADADAAKAKCSAAQTTFTQRMINDEKLRNKYSAMADKMVAAMEKQDMKLQQAYAESSLVIIDPSCGVKEPERPENWSEMQREVDERAERQVSEKSGFNQRELGVISERIFGILRDSPPPDASASEQSAVKKRSEELKRLLGIDQPPPARAEKPAPAAAVQTAPPAPAGQQMQPDQALLECMNRNGEKHEKEIERLGKRAEAAANSENTAAAMAISDSIQRLLKQGCPGGY
jgi:hypothetical protein